MSNTDLVRASRDGDQFHYIWAARRCLLLLSPDKNLRAITIEGASSSETGRAKAVTKGEELIDVAEYYGSEAIEQATNIRYIQVKHSTATPNKEWPAGGLKKTLKGFSERYVALKKLFSAEDLNSKLEFWFVSNRPISSGFLNAVSDAINGVVTKRTANHNKLEEYTGFSGDQLSAFCKLLKLEGGQDGLWDQRHLLVQDINNYLAGEDIDGPTQLKELVTRKALSESAHNPAITKMDLLRALKTNEKALFPAPNLIKNAEGLIPREQESELHKSIVEAGDNPVIVHAGGGVGKSIFSTRIKYGLPADSISILYDCFGDGEYRNASRYRHRHRDGLVQIANELASLGLCHPLIPTSHADASAYSKAFLYRLEQSINSLRSLNSDALLCIVIDAADNAQMAAEEVGESRSFVQDLIRERLPDGVRLVFLCRTHRQVLLAPPPNAKRFELQSFTKSESAAFLRHTFHEATEQDVDEFHRLSSQNPRVQALAISQKISLHEMLRSLGPNPTTVEDTIGNLLELAINRLQDAAVTAIGKAQIDNICAGLAALRPLIPLSVLASISGVDETAIKSFAIDLGRPLLVSGDSIQFFDEPAETWFRDRFKPAKDKLENFLTNLKPLAQHSTYVASALPQLMLEAGQLAQLVELALSNEALPIENPIDRRDVELQRLQFALKASLKAKRYADAAKLALKAGGECAGDERQNKLLQLNTDLASVFMDTAQLEALVSRRTFGSGWIGSHHAYEAGLLSGRKELLGDARSRLRMAQEWLRNWSQLSKEEREREIIDEDDILEIVTAIFNIHGSDHCAEYLRRWTPRSVSYRVGYLLSTRFVDHGRYEDLNSLAASAGNNFWLVLAITEALKEVHRLPPKRSIERTWRLVSSTRVQLLEDEYWRSETKPIQMVTGLVEAVHELSIDTVDKLSELLTRYLPASPPWNISARYDTQRFLLLRAYSLRAALDNRNLDLIDLAHEKLRDELAAKKNYSESQELREFKYYVGTLLPWYQLWAKLLVRSTSSSDITSEILEAKEASYRAERKNYHDEPDLHNKIASIWFYLISKENINSAEIDRFHGWIANLKYPLNTNTLTQLARLAAHTTLKNNAFEFAKKVFELNKNAREDAESVTDSFVKLARAILPASRSESLAYFNLAVEVASKIGDENLSRWDALLYLAEKASGSRRPNPQLAYRLARCAELTYQYVARDKHFNWEATVQAITGLCSNSSLAILSRWRDRDFGWSERLLPIAIDYLVDKEYLDSRLTLMLVPFRMEWDAIVLLTKALACCATSDEKQFAANYVYRYLTLDNQIAATWRKLKNLSIQHGIFLKDIDKRIAVCEREEQSNQSNHQRSPLRDQLNQKDKVDWQAIFDQVDLCTVNGILISYRKFKELNSSYYDEHFFEKICDFIPIGREAEFINVLPDVPDFNLYKLRYFLEKIPESWSDRLAIKSSLLRTIKLSCQRFCMDIRRNRYYEKLPFDLVSRFAGISESDLAEIILDAVSEVMEESDAHRFFDLVGLLAFKLTDSEAKTVLSFGLRLLEPILEKDDADGDWSEALAPSVDIESSIAGYIWACLAAPQSSLRWQAAHVVRALCENKHYKVVDYLKSFAYGKMATAFYDSSLHFYALHARQWLLIGLLGATKNYPQTVLPYVDLLIRFAFEGEPHVIMREFAKQALLRMLDSGVMVDENIRSKLATVNISTFPVVEDESDIVDMSEDFEENEEDKFYFGIDFGPYWLASLGRCFGKSQHQIEHDAIQVIRHDWKVPGSSRWDEDARHRRKIFRDSETHHSHGSYPSADEMRFYLSYHAMMIVAGKLLASTPIRIDSYETISKFKDWLYGYTLTREDGGWLADRRDPSPLERPKWKDEPNSDVWQWSLLKDDFDQNLINSDKKINLWGYWTRISDRRKEVIHVSSALVSHKGSLALLKALQSAHNPHDFRIPHAEDNSQIDFNGFQLKGWIDDPYREDRGLDDQDPWSGDIVYPSYRFSSHIIELMSLSSINEEREWHTNNDNKCVAWSQTWGYYKKKSNEDSEQENGCRFQASFPFIVETLQRLRMNLIVKIEIERRRPYSRMEKDDDKIGFILPSARLFLVRSDGSIHTM